MSKIIIENQSQDTPPIGVFKRTYNMPHFLVPWRIYRPTRKGQCPVDIPTDFQVYVRHGDEQDPNGGCRSNIEKLTELQANLVLNLDSTSDSPGGEPHLSFSSQAPLPNQINIANMTGTGVWAHVQGKGSDGKYTDILPTQVLTGYSTIMYDVRATYYLAVVNTWVSEGDRIREQELTTKPFPVLAGQTAIVQGSEWTSYDIQTADGN